MLQRSLLLSITVLLFSTPSHALSLQELSDRLDRLEQQNNLLQKENQELKLRIEATDQKAEAAVTATEVIADNNIGMQKFANFANKATIGGYGELHYNNLSGKGGASDKDQVDFHRFVLFFGHEFTDDIRFYSELELEHGITKDTADGSNDGEVELEQAYVDFDLNDQHTARAGMFLIPVGIINETHEPPTFYGTERNPVEKNIIPSTWWEGGAGMYGQLGAGFSYDAYIHSGLAVEDDINIRSARQKVSNAQANDLAATARIKYSGIPGLELSLTAQHQENMGQGLTAGLDGGQLFETHVIWSTGPFTLKTLYAMWDIDGTAAKAAGADKQEGYFIEPSFKFSDRFGAFVRFNQWDTKAGSSSGAAADSEKEQWDIGVNYWPHQRVVIKADYQYQNNDDGKDQNGMNLGVGYQF